jgi:hypothetical protein
VLDNLKSVPIISALLALSMIVLCCAVPALAGPPFQTDDPDPVPYRHFEMYAFSLSDGSSADGTVFNAPSYEVNYGVVPNVQLHLVLPFSNFFPPDSTPVTHGIGDTEFGTKVRFVKETPHIPEIGIFPFFEFPTGNADKSLGVGKTWYRLPLWLQKSWGADETKWTSYGGGGYAVVPQEGFKNYPFAGWLVQRTVNKKLTLGTELFGHGTLTPDATRSSTLLDFGGYYEFKEGFDLQFCAGHSIYGAPETYTYLSFYWTWGPKGDLEEGEKNKLPSARKMLSTLTRLRPR